MEQEGQANSPVEPGTNRMLSLSDSVFAFAMTLLILGIPVPIPGDVPASQLVKHVLANQTSFFIWVLSFFVIGNFWIGHNRLFREVRSHDDWLVLLNLIVLLCVAFMPYPTALIGRYSHSRFAVVLYASSLFVTSFTMSLIGLRALRMPALTRSEVARARVRAGMVRGLGLQVVCIVSVAVSFLSLSAAMLCWALIPVAQRVALARLNALTKAPPPGVRR